jgi:hypothetical protein
MIKLMINGQEKLFSNKEGIKRLRKHNPKEFFKIIKCKAINKQVIMVRDFGETGEFNGHKNWLCLHD